MQHVSVYFSIITIHPVPGEASRIIDILDSMQGLTATNPDCLGCFLTVEAREGKSICYMERWRTREALDRHVQSSLYFRVLEAMELSRIPPKVEFYAAKDVGGLDFLEQVRLYSLSVPKDEGTELAPLATLNNHKRK
jgi:quinol monooxygenase YgiN